MNVGLLLVAHKGVASSLLTTVTVNLGRCPLAVEVVELPYDGDLEEVQRRLTTAIDKLDPNDGVLILSDMLGATPCNIASNRRCDIASNTMWKHTRLVTGLNLPMLTRVLNYPHKSLDELVDKAISGGQQGILLVSCSTE